MKVIVSKASGFCFGVSRAMEMAKLVIDKSEKENIPCYSIGQLIHNEKALKLLGLEKLKDIRNPQDADGGLAIVRAHGISDAKRKAFEDAGYSVYDATCPIISKTVQKMKSSEKEGMTCIIIGIENHAETIYLRSCVENCFVRNEFDAIKLCLSKNRNTSVSVFVQTTFPEASYKRILGIFEHYFKNCQIGCGLCLSCIRRRQEARNIAQKCDAVLVLGGENSQNSKDLALSLKSLKKPVFMANGADGLPAELEKELSGFKTVGLCSGTSTPEIVVEQIALRLRSL